MTLRKTHTLIKYVVLLLITIQSEFVFACPDGYSQNSFGMCMPNIDGDVGKAGQGGISETERFIKNLATEIGKTPAAVQECFGNVPRCANEILSAPLALPAQSYIDGLYRQSEGRTHPFSAEFINLAQPYYDFDLRGVTYADDINTGHGMSVAYCDRIFFTKSGNLWIDKNELYLVLHEVEHLGQCQKRGKRTFLAEYILKVGVDIVRTGRINVHDDHDFEKAADAKANSLTDILWNKIRSGSVPVSRGSAPNPQPMIPVRFCQTPVGTCSIPPAMIPMGSRCFCNGPYGQVPGSAY